MKQTLLSLFIAVSSIAVNAQNTYVPDDNFEQALIDLGYDSGALDDYVPTANINTIENINVATKGISDLTGIEDFTALAYLTMYNNQVTNLDISNNISLVYLFAYGNQLSNIDVAANTNLNYLNVGNNQLTSLDVSNNTLLETLHIPVNSITSLELSNNASLIYLDVSTNSLTSLNVQNGNNANITTFKTNYNNFLTCIQVDDATWSTTNWTDINSSTSFDENCTMCIVNIPDSNFKNYLLNHSGININSDTEIQCDEASAYNGTIDCNNMSISDLTGIEAFTTLSQLKCYNNSLTNLDVSNNTNLTWLEANYNNIASIDVSNNVQLNYFHIAENNLSSIDISNNTSLTSVSIRNNDISSFDVANNIFLDAISIEGNFLTSFDVSTNTSLTYLNAKLNNLTSLNVKNGNNSTLVNFWSTGNPNLDCVEVDNASWSDANWTNIDSNTNFNEDCSSLSIDEFEEIVDFELYPNPSNGVINIKSKNVIDKITIYDLQGRIVKVSHPNQKTVRITTPSLQKGIYLICLKGGNAIASKQLIIK